MNYAIKIQYLNQSGTKYELLDVTDEFPEGFNPHVGSQIDYTLAQFEVEGVNYKVTNDIRTTIIDCRRFFPGSP